MSDVRKDIPIDEGTRAPGFAVGANADKLGINLDATSNGPYVVSLDQLRGWQMDRIESILKRIEALLERK